MKIHNLRLATRSGAEVSDTLKYFSERIPATFIYAGIDVERQGLFTGTRGRQIAGRFSLIPTTAFPTPPNDKGSSRPSKPPCGCAGTAPGACPNWTATCTTAPPA
jgi:hypothetical protein